MSLTYVIPDIHGRDDLLADALAEITAHSHGEAGVLVTIGDYVDKGPESKEVVGRLLGGVEGWKFHRAERQPRRDDGRGAAGSTTTGRAC